MYKMCTKILPNKLANVPDFIPLFRNGTMYSKCPPISTGLFLGKYFGPENSRKTAQVTIRIQVSVSLVICLVFFDSLANRQDILGIQLGDI